MLKQFRLSDDIAVRVESAAMRHVHTGTPESSLRRLATGPWKRRQDTTP